MASLRRRRWVGSESAWDEGWCRQERVQAWLNGSCIILKIASGRHVLMAVVLPPCSLPLQKKKKKSKE
jgi:hypothetical protein